MIVKIVPRRKDGRTDFKQLKNYLTEGLTATGVTFETHSFDALTQYITNASVFDGMGDKVDKTIAVEIGNLLSLATAGAEMWAVANQNPRSKDPVLHYIISWPEHERPEVQEIFGAARLTLQALGLEDHQYVIAIHANTENIHAHIEVNRVNPHTYKSRHIEWAHKTLHKAAREAEIKYGWSHDPGLWEVVLIDGEKHIVPNNKYVDPETQKALSSRAKSFEAWTGTESLETWCRGDPANALQKTMKENTLTSWDAVHEVLAPFGLTIAPSGGGGYKVFSGKGTSDETVVAASRAFRFFKPAQFEKENGPYTPPDPDRIPPPFAGREYKRDPVKRALRKEARRQMREDLFKRYAEEKNAVITVRDKLKAHFKKQQATLEKQHLSEMNRKYAEERARLKLDMSIPSSQKQPLYSLMRLQYEDAIRTQRTIFKTARKEFSATLPALPSWREWVEHEASMGDEAAVSALRGIVYRDRREKDSDELDEGEYTVRDANDTPAIKPYPARAYDDPSLNNDSAALTWSVTTNGRIIYSFKGTEQRRAFIDEGPAVTFGRALVDDDALRAALLHARQKWGPTLKLDGGDQIFRERAARMAIELGLRLENKDLIDYQRTLLDTRPTHAPGTLHKQTPRSSDEVLGQLMHDNPESTHAFADRTHRYSGSIVAISETHIIQRTDAGKYILHANEHMATMPKIGREVTIRYDSHGVGRHSLNRPKGR